MENSKEDEEIKKLPLKERLEYQKIQAETYALKKPFLTKSSVIWTIITVVLTIAIFIATGYFSDWFSVRLKKLENKKILIDAETITLKREKNILENQKNELELNTKKLKAEKTLLEEEYETKNSELVKMFEDKKVKLEKEHDDRKVGLVEEYTKLKEEVKRMSSFTNWYDKGVGENVHGRYEEAISSFTNALSKETDDNSRAYALNYRGAIYFKNRKNNEALADFEESAILKPENPRPYHNMTLIYILRKDYKRAFEVYKEAIRLYGIDGEDNTAYVFSKDVDGLFKPVEGEEEIKAYIKKKTEELGQRLMGL